MVNLTQKERTLLEDQKHHEELCIKKYGNYAEQAQDPQKNNSITTLLIRF
jgi:spore coat protein CotF